MNPDAIKSLLSQVTSVVLAILVALGVMTADQSNGVMGAVATLFSSASAAIPAVLLIVNVATSIWRHYGMKKVPEKAVALELPKTISKPVVGTTVDLGPLSGKAKVVG